MIRKAEYNRDFESIHRLILELAEYEKAPAEVITSPETLEEHCSGNKPLAFAWVLENSENRVVGAAICYIRYSTWKGPVFYLEDLIVEEAFRNQGFGKLLLDTVIEFAKSQKFKRVVWQVLDWNQPAIEFYKKYSVSFDDSWINVTLDLE